LSYIRGTYYKHYQLEAQSRIWKLLVKEMSGELTPAEKQELQHLLAADPEMAAKWHIMQRTGIQTPEEMSFSTKEQLLDNILGSGKPYSTLDAGEAHTAISPVSPGRITWPWMAAAAVMLAAVATFFTLYISRKDIAAEWSIVQAKPGSRSRVVLPDGSIVVLNAGSELSYPVNFMKGKREVKLTGEGYFQVAKQAELPFVIHTAVIDVNVLGTEFNLRAYPGETNTETSLISGAVEIVVKNKSEKRILLKPNQKVAIDNQLANETYGNIKETYTGKEDQLQANNGISIVQLQKDPVDNTVLETAWLDNKLAFRNEPFEQLAAQIERAYNVKMTFKNEALKGLSFSGKVNNESLSELLNILQATKYFKYSIDSGQVTIY